MQKSYIPAERRKRIQEHLITNKVASLIDLSKILNTSTATVRRDLEKLEKTGFLERTRGGAVLSRRLSQESEYQQRLLDNPEEKRLIGKIAAALIEDGDVVFLNGGTTTIEIARHIRPNANITIITNSLSIASEINNAGFELIVLGGIYQPTSLSVGGHFSTECLNQIYADKSFLGVDGISIKYGFTFPLKTEAKIVRLMMERTRGPIYVVTDHTKWGTVSTFEVAQIGAIHGLITDKALNIAARDDLASHSVEVIFADEN
ncbi:MAG: DeoR/GlpR family DNA-binding transcription regulator [Chloroflexota bacterium]